MLALRGIGKTYARGGFSRQVLDDVSLEVRAGEVVGFVGANGAGKTTTMRIALGVTEPDAGDVTINGRPAQQKDRERIGYMPEERGLYGGMRLGAQLAYFAQLHGLDRRAARRAAAAWLERLGLADRDRDRLEDLSLGNQQRVQLAAALVHDPALLILDEPFSGLDPRAVDLMVAVVREQADGGVPVLFSSHQLDLVERVCDRVCVLHAGRVLADAATREIAGTSGLAAAYRTLTADADAADTTTEELIA